MKKIYTAPEADLLCFRPVEDLALSFDNLWPNIQLQDGSSDAAVTSGGDIKINISN